MSDAARLARRVALIAGAARGQGRSHAGPLVCNGAEVVDVSHGNAAVTRWPNADYLANPGFWRRTRSLANTIPPDSRVPLVGDLFGTGSMESAVRDCERAAGPLLTTVGAPAEASLVTGTAPR